MLMAAATHISSAGQLSSGLFLDSENPFSPPPRYVSSISIKNILHASAARVVFGTMSLLTEV
jgi:hypothetical protein